MRHRQGSRELQKALHEIAGDTIPHTTNVREGTKLFRDLTAGMGKLGTQAFDQAITQARTTASVRRSLEAAIADPSGHEDSGIAAKIDMEEGAAGEYTFVEITGRASHAGVIAVSLLLDDDVADNGAPDAVEPAMIEIAVQFGRQKTSRILAEDVAQALRDAEVDAESDDEGDERATVMVYPRAGGAIVASDVEVASTTPIAAPPEPHPADADPGREREPERDDPHPEKEPDPQPSEPDPGREPQQQD